MTAENLQLWLLLTSAASLGVAILLLIPPRCRECKTRMVKLSESGDDLHLEPEEQSEEQVGSVNYDGKRGELEDHLSTVKRRGEAGRTSPGGRRQPARRYLSRW